MRVRVAERRRMRDVVCKKNSRATSCDVMGCALLISTANAACT